MPTLAVLAPSTVTRPVNPAGRVTARGHLPIVQHDRRQPDASFHLAAREEGIRHMHLKVSGAPARLQRLGRG